MNLHQLVTSLFEIERGHDGEVDGTPEVHQVGLRLVLDGLLLGVHGAAVLLVRALVIVGFIVGFVLIR